MFCCWWWEFALVLSSAWFVVEALHVGHFGAEDEIGKNFVNSMKLFHFLRYYSHVYQRSIVKAKDNIRPHWCSIPETLMHPDELFQAFCRVQFSSSFSPFSHSTKSNMNRWSIVYCQWLMYFRVCMYYICIQENKLCSMIQWMTPAVSKICISFRYRYK